MKKESMRKYSLLGLVLIAASAVTAAVLPKNESNLKVNGVLEDSTNPDIAGLQSCTAGTGGNCTLSVTGVGSRTSEGSNRTSSITLLGDKVRTITTNVNVVTNAALHTSVPTA